MGFATAEACGTVRCAGTDTSLSFLKEVEASDSERSLLGSLGSLGVGFHLWGCAIWASRVSNGNRLAFGSPIYVFSIILRLCSIEWDALRDVR
jgi:hypothetical protein